MADEVKRSAVCKKVFMLADGTESRSAHHNAIGLEFRFANDVTRTIMLDQFPDPIERRLAWFGRSEKFGNAYAGAKGDPDAALESFDTIVELLEGGEWTEARESMGPRPSLVADAIIQAITTQTGAAPDETQVLAIREAVKDKTTREGALKDPVIKAAHEAIKAQRAATRAQEAATAAVGATLTFNLTPAPEVAPAPVAEVPVETPPAA